MKEIHRRPLNYPHKGPVTRKIFPFDDVIMININVTLEQWTCVLHARSSRIYCYIGKLLILIYFGHASKWHLRFETMLAKCSLPLFIFCVKPWKLIASDHCHYWRPAITKSNKNYSQTNYSGRCLCAYGPEDEVMNLYQHITYFKEMCLEFLFTVNGYVCLYFNNLTHWCRVT